MPRKHRPLDRTSGALRDTSIVVIACEDTHAVKQYFSKFRTRRVQYKIYPTLDGDSSPRAVMERLDYYRSEFATEEHDELWICIDADHWIRGQHQRDFSQVLQECRSKGYGVAISNPCFEVWLLMHYANVDDSLLLELLGEDPSSVLSDDQRSSFRCDRFEARLRQTAGGYNKSNVARLSLTAAQVLQATERARRSDGASDVPKCPGTRVYKLIDTLQRRDSIDLDQ
ncbi:MAG: RloB family protein [Pirellulaceae bacterium]